MHCTKKHKMVTKMVEYKYYPYGYEEKYGVGNSSDSLVTLRCLKRDIKSCKVDNHWIIHTKEKQAEVNVILLNIFSELQREGPPWINLGHGECNNQGIWK